MTKVIFLVGLAVLVVSHVTVGQTKMISLKGVLTANNGDAIPGCNVVIKGKMMEASATQACGDFEISVPENYEGVLVFSCLTPRVWEIQLKKLKDKENIIIVLTDWDKFENGPCEKNFKGENRIKIHKSLSENYLIHLPWTLFDIEFLLSNHQRRTPWKQSIPVRI